jgi:excisionase family DNA binding protein
VSTVGTRWYTLAEAAPVLGVSVDTVRRRLKRGEIEARQVHTQHGPTWEVCLALLWRLPEFHPTLASSRRSGPESGLLMCANPLVYGKPKVAHHALNGMTPE